MAEQELSKAEYLQRYLSGPSQPEAAQERRRRKKKPPRGAGRAGIRIVDDDISLNSIAAVEEKEEEEDDGDLPVVAEFIDERPDVVKFMEAFRRNTKWKLLGDWNRDSQSSDVSGPANSTVRQQRHDTPSPPRQQRHDTPSPPRQQRHDTPESSPPKTPWFALLDNSPPRRQRHDTPEPSPPRASSHLKRQATPDLSPPRKKTYSSNLDSSPPWWKKSESPSLKKQSRTKGGSWNTSDADRRPGCVRSSSLGKQVHSQSSDSDLSPPRRSLPAGKDERRSRSPLHHCDAKRCPKKANVMFSGVKAGLVSADVLRREQQELQRNERNNKHLEEESRHAETVFRDKSGRKRDLAQERLEQRQKAKAQSERDEQYAKWGKGLVQERQQQQNVEDAIKEMQKPLARYIDDQDLDRMLRAQEREGDPMAALIKKRKAKENKEKEKPRYQGPAPLPNRFNIWPGHRWDGVDRSNGFEQQRFARIANKKAVQELAYKWSIEDM